MTSVSLFGGLLQLIPQLQSLEMEAILGLFAFICIYCVIFLGVFYLLICYDLLPGNAA